jgi:predicted lipid-binding transport protein (Tim44 family)
MRASRPRSGSARQGRDRRDPVRVDRQVRYYRRRAARTHAQITVRFVSQLISVTRDKASNVIDGNAEKVTDVTDVWTFARDLSSRDPNWKLVATEAGQ